MGYFFRQDFPGDTMSKDTLRLLIIARDMQKQNLSPKDINHVETGATLATWNLVAPTDFQEQLGHDWEEYHSFQGRASQLVSDAYSGVARAMQIKGGFAKSDGNTNPAKAKVDSPLVYTGSQRFEYSFTIPFMRYRGGSFKDVFEPIHHFRKLSCASLGLSIDTINFPAIFEIGSRPNEFIALPYAALVNVQSTYQAPYVDGYPQRAECTLTFRDIRPLYREWFADGKGKVTVGVAVGRN